MLRQLVGNLREVMLHSLFALYWAKSVTMLRAAFSEVNPLSRRERGVF